MVTGLRIGRIDNQFFYLHPSNSMYLNIMNTINVPTRVIIIYASNKKIEFDIQFFLWLISI